ncbi:AhpC/TSA family protein [Flavobacteriales bacterium]|nr:AhpC/TSA family protein [Flavobacteriales bacterium]
MMRLFFISIVIFTLASCTDDRGTINGTLTNAENDSWIYLEKISPTDVIKVDSCKIDNSTFSFNYSSDSINFFRISFSNENYALIAFNKGDTIEFKANATTLVDYEAIGSDEVEGNTLLLNIIRRLKQNTDSLSLIYQKSIGTDEEELVLNSIRIQYDELLENHKKNIEQFIDENPTLFINLIAGQQLGSIADNINYYKKIYTNLESKYPNNLWIENIKENVLSLEKTAVGAIAPDFSIKDENGKPFSLSSLRGTVVLLDFWASWCVPCRKENPMVVELYKEYKPKGLEIIGISLDDSTRNESAKNEWLKAINQDGLKWIQLSELQGFESPICKEYGIESIPSTFLIDEDGVIIGRNLRGTVLRNKLIEIFD